MIFSNYLYPPPFSLRSTCRKRFTPEEDAKLKELCSDADQYKNWEEVAKKMPGRSARQCRDRYNVTLKNYIEKKPWTHEEDDLIIQKYQEIGPRWVAISSFLVGRSGNNIKNRWHKHINKEKTIPPFVPTTPPPPINTMLLTTGNSTTTTTTMMTTNSTNINDIVSPLTLYNNDDAKVNEGCLHPSESDNESDNSHLNNVSIVDFKVDEEKSNFVVESKPQDFINNIHNTSTTSTTSTSLAFDESGADSSDFFFGFLEPFESHNFLCLNKSGFNEYDSLDDVY